MPTAIRIENVSKLYRLGVIGTGTISHDLNRWWHRIRGKEDPYAKVGQVNDRTQKSSAPDLQATGTVNSSPDYVWALKDINLDVQQGEILGIIGRNGAGKSTLLKLLSRVTAPTTGSIKTKGRIASLLEVGTGFHPELTGRENIYLNGAILGMKWHEIRRRLDEIVDFSGCAKYVDTPVKRYSSGMTVRLGFAVAAHLDCEILIVDEVLAVGDFEFQSKCISKMKDVGSSGRTVLFVSHNLAAVESLCSKATSLKNGEIARVEEVQTVIQQYLQSRTNLGTAPRRDDDENGYLLTAIGGNSVTRKCGDPVQLEFIVDCPKGLSDPSVGLVIYDAYESPIVGMSSRFQAEFGDGCSLRWRFACGLRDLPLCKGAYHVSVWIGDKKTDVAQFSSAFVLNIESGDPFRCRTQIPKEWGKMYWIPNWTFAKQ